MRTHEATCPSLGSIHTLYIHQVNNIVDSQVQYQGETTRTDGQGFYAEPLWSKVRLTRREILALSMKGGVVRGSLPRDCTFTIGNAVEAVHTLRKHFGPNTQDILLESQVKMKHAFFE